MKVEDLLELRDKLNKIISRYTAKLENVALRSSEYSHIITPPMDVYAEDKRQLVYVEAPDLVKKTIDLKINPSSNSLVFSASKRNVGENERNYINIDRQAGEYSRNISLTADSSVSSVSYSYKLGVLRIEIIYEGYNNV